MMRSELASSKLPLENLGGAMIVSHPLMCKNEEDDDGDSVSSKLDLHFSKDDIIADDDEDFSNFDSLKPMDRNYTSKLHVDIGNYQSPDENDVKLSNVSQEFKRINSSVRSGDMIYSLLSILGTHNKDDMSKTLYAMSTSPESCVAMRQSGCLPLLIHLLHNSETDHDYFDIRNRSAVALRNIINVHCEDQRGRQESRVLRLLEQIRDYCDHLRTSMAYNDCSTDRSYFQGLLVDVQHPVGAVTALMKLTFDEEHRHAVCTLGGIQALAELLQLQQEIFGHSLNPDHITMRRYTCMALTNLTFGDGTNKALLCSMPGPLRSLVLQLQSESEELCQVAASVLRNLSWHADASSKRNLRNAGVIQVLTQTMLVVKKEPTLKSLLSALWNFSAHCPENKEDICAIQGALQLLVWSLSFKSSSKTLAVVENGGGVLRNVSSHVAVRSDYRVILRKHGCLATLLKHLRSPSLTVVSNACGTLWNLSAHCLEDQKILCSLGAIEMLKNLVHSKHKMISLGSAAALKNLLSSSAFMSINGMTTDPYALLMSSWVGRGEGSFCYNIADRPGLHVRRQRALQRELQSRYLSETCDTSSPIQSPMTPPVPHDIAQPLSKGLQIKTSANFVLAKPPPFLTNFSDVIYHSDSDILNRSRILRPMPGGNNAQMANLSLEHETMDGLFGLEDNFYSPGMFLSCHESIATGGQDTAADFLPCDSQTFDGNDEHNDLEWKALYDNELFLTRMSHSSYFRDLPDIENISAVHGLDEEMIRVNLNDGRDIAELAQAASEQENASMIQSPHHHHHNHHQLLSNPNAYTVQNIQGNNLINHPMVFDELPSTEQLFNSCEKNEIVSFQFNPVVEVPQWHQEISNRGSISDGFLSKKMVYDQVKNSPKSAKKSFLRPPTNYNSSKFNIDFSKTQVVAPLCNDTSMLYTEFDKRHICYRDDRLFDENTHDENIVDTLSASIDPNMTAEHELALQENANLVLSVLERTSLTESNLSSDIHLLENETISLISDNEVLDELPMSTNVFDSVKFCDDTEDSLITGTEHTLMYEGMNSEDEAPSIAYEVEPVMKGKPRIVKPGTVTKPSNQGIDRDASNEPKAIRGRRKVLYPGKTKALTATDKRVVSSSPSRVGSTGAQKDDKKNNILNSTAGNVHSRSQAQMKVSSTSIKDKLNKARDDKKTIKVLLSCQRPQSAFIRNPGSSAAIPEEAIKGAKIKSYSLPPGQKPPSSKDSTYAAQKPKPKLLSKQDTFIKLVKPGANSSSDNLHKQEQKQSVKSIHKCKPKKIPSKIQNSGSSLGPSASSSEKIASVSSTNANGKYSTHSNMSKSGSINSISSSRCSSAPKVPPKINIISKQNIKPKLMAPMLEDETRIDHKMKNDDAFGCQDASRLQKSSTYDKLKEFFGEESVYKSDNADSEHSEVKTNNMETDSLEKTFKNKTVKVDIKNVRQSHASKIPNVSRKPLPDKKTCPGKKDSSTKFSKSINHDSKVFEGTFHEKKKLVENGIKLQIGEIVMNVNNTRDKMSSNKSKPLSNSISASNRREISVMNAKNLSKTLPMDNSKIQLPEDDHRNKSKQRPSRGFSFWKKQPTKSKDEESQEQLKSALPIPNSKKASSNKNKISPKAESPIRKKVLGWFKKGSETHTIIAEKNKALASKEDLASDLNFNRNSEFLMEDVHLTETLIATLDARNGNSSPIRAAVVQPFNYHSSDCVTSVQSSDNPNIYTPPKFTKTELLLARHRSSRLASDSRSSMAMSIDSLKVNSLDSFQNTDRSFSDVPSETIEEDDLSSSSHLLQDKVYDSKRNQFFAT